MRYLGINIPLCNALLFQSHSYNYIKHKAQGNKTPQASTSTDPRSTSIGLIKANEYFQKNFTGNPFGYVCDICDRLCYMSDLKQEKHISVLAPESLMLLNLRHV
jgi:hypothetical protein